MTADFSTDDRSDSTAEENSDAMKSQDESLGSLLIRRMKDGLHWFARFYGTIFLAGIVLYVLKIFQTTIPSFSGVIFAVRALVALITFIYLGTLLPTWLTDRLDRIRISSGNSGKWGKLYVFYRIFR